jgi:hypothetical protein
MATLMKTYPGITPVTWPDIDEELVSMLLARREFVDSISPSGRILQALTAPEKAS